MGIGDVNGDDRGRQRQDTRESIIAELETAKGLLKVYDDILDQWLEKTRDQEPVQRTQDAIRHLGLVMDSIDHAVEFLRLEQDQEKGVEDGDEKP